MTGQIPRLLAYTQAALQESLEMARPDFLFVSPQTNPVALLLRSEGLPTRLVMASYDVEAVRLARFAESHTGLEGIALGLEARRARRFERENLCRYDGIIAVSELDRDLFVAGYGFSPERVLVVENGVDPSYFTFQERSRGGPVRILYVGSLAYRPNEQAAFRLLKEVMPRVRRRYPDAVALVVGQGPSAQLLAENDGSSVVVTGRVEDVRPHLASATVACFPLLSGSGTKYKILEALSAGVPVVTTPLGTEGFRLEHGRHLLVGRTDEDLSEAVLKLVEEPSLASSLARAGREEIERLYSWDANLSRLDGWLDELLSKPRRTSDSH